MMTTNDRGATRIQGAPHKRPSRKAGFIPPKHPSQIRPSRTREMNTVVRYDWELNHILIERATFDLISKLHRSPTLQEIAGVVGMSIEGIRQHLKTIDLSDAVLNTRIHVRKVLDAQALRAMKGKREDVALYMALNFNWTPKIQIENSSPFDTKDSEARIKRISAILAKTGLGEDQIGALVAELCRARGITNSARSGGIGQDAEFVEV